MASDFGTGGDVAGIEAVTGLATVIVVPFLSDAQRHYWLLLECLPRWPQTTREFVAGRKHGAVESLRLSQNEKAEAQMKKG